MRLGLPQLIWLALMLLSLGVSLGMHGTPRPPLHAGYALVEATIHLTLLLWGGFFGRRARAEAGQDACPCPEACHLPRPEELPGVQQREAEQARFLFCRCDLDEGLVVQLLQKLQDPSLHLMRLHRLCYLLKADGVPFEFTFDFWGRGPYSYGLEDKLFGLVLDGVLSQPDRVNGPQIKDAARAAHIVQSSGAHHYAALVDHAAARWSLPDDRKLELLAAVHYVKVSGNIQRDDDQVVRTMHLACGNRFSESDVQQALLFLRALHILRGEA